MILDVGGRFGLVVLAAAVCALGGAAIARGTPTDVFFSEYIEGSSNNKALEIFNGTGAPVNLATGNYVVQMYFNGSASAGLTASLTGSVADGDVWVLANPLAGPAITAQADQTTLSSSWYNGDDAVVLRKGGTGGLIVDVIGQVGLDPGSSGAPGWRARRTTPSGGRAPYRRGTRIQAMRSFPPSSGTASPPTRSAGSALTLSATQGWWSHAAPR